jgi:hypothetical protein
MNLEIDKRMNSAWAEFGLRLGTVGPAQRPKWPGRPVGADAWRAWPWVAWWRGDGRRHSGSDGSQLASWARGLPGEGARQGYGSGLSPSEQGDDGAAKPRGAMTSQHRRCSGGPLGLWGGPTARGGWNRGGGWGTSLFDEERHAGRSSQWLGGGDDALVNPGAEERLHSPAMQTEGMGCSVTWFEALEGHGGIVTHKRIEEGASVAFAVRQRKKWGKEWGPAVGDAWERRGGGTDRSIGRARGWWGWAVVAPTWRKRKARKSGGGGSSSVGWL